VPNCAARFHVACLHCPMDFEADRIRDAEARAMRDHLRTRHAALGVGSSAALGAILDHYRVTPAR
jgi:hypothetical protein